MSKTRNEQARDSMRKLHERRKAQGICIWCSGMIDDTKYSMCARCRAKSREDGARYRAKAKELHNKIFVQPEEERIIPEDHKCWTCEWSRFEGDRFFCPFAEGTCAKEGTL